MKIDKYSFGKIVIDGVAYSSDIIIYPDYIDASWWRKEGHRLQPADLTGIVDAHPDLLIIGTGFFSRMDVPEETRKFLAAEGIDIRIERTGKAVGLFNNAEKDKVVVAAFHLTC